MTTQYESAIVMGAITPEIKYKAEISNALKRKLDAPTLKPRMFKILDSTGLPMNVRFCGQVAEYIREGTIPETTLFRQPAFDNSGEPRSGLMTLDNNHVEEIL